jgi:hypothetical protein
MCGGEMKPSIRKFKVMIPRHTDKGSYVATLQELAREPFMDEEDVEVAALLNVGERMTDVCGYNIERVE